jgi:hypothetical protein
VLVGVRIDRLPTSSLALSIWLLASTLLVWRPHPRDGRLSGTRNERGWQTNAFLILDNDIQHAHEFVDRPLNVCVSSCPLTFVVLDSTTPVEVEFVFEN